MNKVIVKKIEKLLKYQFKAIFLRRYKGTCTPESSYLTTFDGGKVNVRVGGLNQKLNYSIPILCLSLQNSRLARHDSFRKKKIPRQISCREIVINKHHFTTMNENIIK